MIATLPEAKKLRSHFPDFEWQFAIHSATVWSAVGIFDQQVLYYFQDEKTAIAWSNAVRICNLDLSIADTKNFDVMAVAVVEKLVRQCRSQRLDFKGRSLYPEAASARKCLPTSTQN